MARFLFVMPPLAGHTNPAVSVAAALTVAGHEVAWVTYPGSVGHLLPDGATVFPVCPDNGGVSLVRQERRAETGVAAVKFLWEDFLLPIAREMAPVVRSAIQEFAPSVVVADQQALAGGIVAEDNAILWVTSATTPAEVVNPLQLVPKIAAWVDEAMRGLERDVGVSHELVGTFDPRFSRDLVLLFSTEALTGPLITPYPLALVGPAFGDRPERPDIPWDWIERFSCRILVSLGTESGDVSERFMRETMTAVADQPYGVLLVAPGGYDGDVPTNVLVRPHVPQIALLPHLDAVVSHAGHNTVCETLAHGVPLVLAPIRDDQPLIAGQVTAAGAGVRLKFARSRAADIGTAITEVLDNPSYRQAAARVADSFAAAGGAATAARLLGDLAEGRPAAVLATGSSTSPSPSPSPSTSAFAAAPRAGQD